MSAAPGLYVHVPFCRTKCPYCAFASTTERSAIPRWLAALEREAERRASLLTGFDTLYIGGGTPSSLPDETLAELLSSLRHTLAFADEREVTVEVNPGDLDPGRAAWLRTLEVNRISLGVQSLDDGELRMLGRRHDARQAREAVGTLRAAGFTNLSIDLIGGLPGQDVPSRLASARGAVELGPDHLSCYELTIEAGTPLARAVARGELTLPDEDRLAEGAVAVADLLAQHGYVQYEVSNYARSAAHRCEHNLKYWRHVPYVGLGPAAHSFDGAERWWNLRSPTAYADQLLQGSSAVEGRERLSDEQLRVERLGLGLRTADGVAVAHLGPEPQWRQLVAQLVNEGLVLLADGRLKPTANGLWVADGLAKALLVVTAPASPPVPAPG
ncbi:MAG: radical SAM family heme chaperone HemW [Deltaproteobacteria bacterium]|nr:radical SAM family heme chaperone HemW [Deltaproteobacteria bacterium]